MRLTWATDIHLDFITSPENPEVSSRNLDVFCETIKKENSDAMILSGDISLSPYLTNHLFELERRLSFPVYFVLGNHDFWGGSFENVRNKVSSFSRHSDYLKYLSVSGYFMLTSNVAVVGHDGWYDGFYSDPKKSNAMMNDWNSISDFSSANVYNFNGSQAIDLDVVLSVSRSQSLLAAKHIANGIKRVIQQQDVKKVLVVTHVPPFTNPIDKREYSLDLYPWYSSKTMGDMLLEASKHNSNIEFEVFCGHVHTGFEGAITKNLYIHAGEAEYSQPRSQGSFNVSL